MCELSSPIFCQRKKKQRWIRTKRRFAFLLASKQILNKISLKNVFKSGEAWRLIYFRKLLVVRKCISQVIAAFVQQLTTNLSFFGLRSIRPVEEAQTLLAETIINYPNGCVIRSNVRVMRAQEAHHFKYLLKRYLSRYLKIFKVISSIHKTYKIQ